MASAGGHGQGTEQNMPDDGWRLDGCRFRGDQLDFRETRRAQILDQLGFVGAAESLVVQTADGVVVGRDPATDHHIVLWARSGHSRSYVSPPTRSWLSAARIWPALGRLFGST